MSVQVEKLENNMAKLTIEVEASQFDAAMKNAYNCLLYTSHHCCRERQSDTDNVQYLPFLLQAHILQNKF